MKEVFAPGNADSCALHRQELWTELEGREGSKDVREWCAELADNTASCRTTCDCSVVHGESPEHSIEEVKRRETAQNVVGNPVKKIENV